MSSLLDPDFLRRLGRMRLALRKRFSGSSAGTRRSLRRGSSAEFAEHRPYYAGDDVRRIDWNAYARLEELVLRLYVAEEDLDVHLLIDRSGSLATGNPPKIQLARRVAAALGYVALSGSERVSLSTFGSALDPSRGAMRGQKRIGALLRELEAIEAHGQTSLAEAVAQFIVRTRKPGVVVVISDFLDERGFQSPLDQLLARKHEPVLLQVLDPEEVRPSAGADVELVDSETGAVVDVSIDEATLRAYQIRLAAFFAELSGYAKKRGLFYARIESDEALEDVILGYLRGASP